MPVTALPLLFLLFFGCFLSNAAAEDAAAQDVSAVFSSQTLQEQIAQYRRRAADEAPRLKMRRLRAQRIAAALNDRQLAAQVIISGIDGRGHLSPDMKILLAECPAGGVMLFRYNLNTDNDAIQNLIAETQEIITSRANIPSFVTIDHEGGAVNRFRAGVADLPPPASYWEMAHNAGGEAAATRINADSYRAGKALAALGINVNLAPVAEYLNDDNRDFLENRSYGPDPDFTAAAAAAFIAGMEQAGILCVVKHFPGSAGTDPHRFPSVLTGDKAALAKLVAPFAALTRKGRWAIMVSHSRVPAWDSEIASLSPAIMGEWLRQELGFNGLIICDDFSMASARSAASTGNHNILSPEAAAVLSLAAGADMVLVWPPDLRRTHRAIMAALAAGDNGEVFRERLREAAERIIFEKMHMGLINGE